MFNKVTLVGRISTDLELRYTGSNKVYCRFNLAVNKNYKNEYGEYETDFIPVTVWGKPAENLVQYQNKGSLILVDGSISMNNYTDKDGNNRTSFEVMTSNVQFLNSKRTNDETTTESVKSDPDEDFGNQIEIDDNFLD
jgi:single-strand DNA-binding protein|nr:MAG TPA: Single strand binding protein [Bacteriophage sp.]